VRVSSEGHAQPVSQWWWRWSDVDRRVGCKWVVPGPGPDSYDRQQWLQTAREQYECRKRCRTATRSVSQADVANGLANRSGRAAYLSETRSDVRSSGARSRLCEWLGRAGRVKMCSRREEIRIRRSVRLPGGDEGIFVKQTTRRTSECINSIDRRATTVRGQDKSVCTAAPNRDYCSGVRQKRGASLRETILVLGYDCEWGTIIIGAHGLPTAVNHINFAVTLAYCSTVHLHLMPCRARTPMCSDEV
jgi:hypothetical protein